MAAKSLGTPRVNESSVASRHTSGSNHIWKTSSGKSDLKSHFTVSQRLGERDKEGMRGLGKAGLFTLGRWRASATSFFALSASTRCNEIHDRPSLEVKSKAKVL